jgi:Ras-related protein Rab-8A
MKEIRKMKTMPIKIKLCVLGDPSVGKTSLIRHYTEGYFKENYLSTIGVAFNRKTLEVNFGSETKEVNMTIWDLGGQSMWATVRANYLNGAQGVLLLFDLTNKSSLSHIRDWYIDVIQVLGDIPLSIIGNKSDLEYNPNIVSIAKDLCEKINPQIRFYITSAKEGTNMEEVFEDIALDILKKITDDANE